MGCVKKQPLERPYQFQMQKTLDRASAIRLVIFDVDGVLTDGRLFFDPEGGEFKAFHARDGLGIKMLQESGVKVAIISGRTSESVTHRMKALGIEHVYQGQQDKIRAFEALCSSFQRVSEQVAHVGDDLLDLPLMRRVGLAIAVNDAHQSIKPYAHWITTLPGGTGAAREVCDLIMQAQETLDAAVERYSRDPT